MSKREKAIELLRKLDRKAILEITVGNASTYNLMEDLLEVYRDNMDELIEECEEYIKE